MMLLLRQLVRLFGEDGGVNGGVLALPFLLLVTARTWLVTRKKSYREIQEGED